MRGISTWLYSQLFLWDEHLTSADPHSVGETYGRSQLCVKYITLFPSASWPHRYTHFPLLRDIGLPPPSTLLLLLLRDPCKLNHLGLVQRLFPGQLAKQTNTSYEKLKSGLIEAALSLCWDDSDIYEGMQQHRLQIRRHGAKALFT